LARPDRRAAADEGRDPVLRRMPMALRPDALEPVDMGSEPLQSRNPKAGQRRTKLFDRAIVRVAIVDSFRKLDPRLQAQNPVMFVVLIGAVLVTVLLARDAARGKDVLFNLQIALWLWFTLLFANFAEAMAEGRGKAQAA